MKYRRKTHHILYCISFLLVMRSLCLTKQTLYVCLFRWWHEHRASVVQYAETYIHTYIHLFSDIAKTSKSRWIPDWRKRAEALNTRSSMTPSHLRSGGGCSNTMFPWTRLLCGIAKKKHEGCWIPQPPFKLFGSIPTSGLDRHKSYYAGHWRNCTFSKL